MENMENMECMRIIGRYKNGNYGVIVLNDGTKIRHNNLDFLYPDKPESMDVKITNCCDIGCRFCHEDSKPTGAHGDILNVPFFDTLLPYTEIACGGGNPLAHPDLVQFLEQLKRKKLIPSMTVNQIHFMKNIEMLHELVDRQLVYGLGISLTNPTEEFIQEVKKFPNAVIHVINGIVPMEYLRRLAKHNLKILILGYKEFRRGEESYKTSCCEIESFKTELYDMLGKIWAEKWFKVVSFDNLAIKQLNPARIMTKAEWDEFYMGDDGQFTMYIDLVKKEFAKSSVSTDRYPIADDIKAMFDVVRGTASSN